MSVDVYINPEGGSVHLVADNGNYVYGKPELVISPKQRFNRGSCEKRVCTIEELHKALMLVLEGEQ